VQDVRVTVKKPTFDALRCATLGAGGAAAGVREALCTVCHEDFCAGEEAVILNCEHSFHVACARKWLCEYSNKCPVCKRCVA
jgi:Ring finger domain